MSCLNSPNKTVDDALLTVLCSASSSALQVIVGMRHSQLSTYSATCSVMAYFAGSCIPGTSQSINQKHKYMKCEGRYKEGVLGFLPFG